MEKNAGSTPVCKINEYGNKEWYLDDKRMTDMPKYKWEIDINEDLLRQNHFIIISDNGDRSWWSNGKRHREDGPAIELNNGVKFWCVNSEWLDPEKTLKNSELRNKHPKLIESMLVYLVHNS